MTQTLLHQLNNHCSNIHLNTMDQLKNGHNLILLALHLLYNGNNQFLASKISATNSNKSLGSPIGNNKAGNNVIAINALLKHIKNDNGLQLETWVRELTFYNLLEDQQLLCKFINWMLHYSKASSITIENPNQQLPKETEYHSLNLKQAQECDPNSERALDQDQVSSVSSNRFRNIEIIQNNKFRKLSEDQRFKTEEPQKQTTGLENLYFASNLKENIQQQQIIISPEKGDKIVRKGSFKLLKPKVTFKEQNQPSQQPKQLPEFQPLQQQKTLINFRKSHSLVQNQTGIYEPDELKQISMIEASNNNISQNMNLSQPSNFYQQTSYIYDPEEFGKKKNFTSTPMQVNQQKQIENRKTIPKNLSKPPLYRSSSKNKENAINASSDKDRTVQASLKKKNFFNFSQDQMVSNFNFESNDPMKSFGNQIPMNYDSVQTLQGQKSKLFSRIKQLKSCKKSQIKQYLCLENEIEEQANTGNFIQQNDWKQGKNEYYQHERVNKYSSADLSRLKASQETQSNSKILKLKNHFLQKQLYTLEKQILKEQDNFRSYQQKNQSSQTHTETISSHRHKHSASLVNNDQNKSVQKIDRKNASFNSSKKSSRKITKVELNQLSQNQKNIIVDWLMNLHIIGGSQAKTTELIDVFKNGVKFVELCNHYIGRGKTIPHFSNPKKNAQVHSNYSKVFEYLKTFSQFDQPQLLFSYELFVPYPQENSIWNLLSCMHNLFVKKGRGLNKTSSRNEQLIYRKQNESARQKSASKQSNLTMNKEGNSLEKEECFDKIQLTLPLKKSQNSSRKQSTFSKPVEFVRQVPDELKHKDLIQQNQEPETSQNNQPFSRQNQANINAYFQGYNQKYLRKSIQNSASKQKPGHSSLETPKKTINVQHKDESLILANNLSVLKGSVRRSSSKKTLENQIKKLEYSSSRILSAKKTSNKKDKAKQMPKISLNMQMKVQKILKHFQLNSLTQKEGTNHLVKLQLFKDPIRNGTLVNVLFGKMLQNQREAKYFSSPHSIEHCRHNYLNFFGLIKNKYGQEGFEMFEKYVEFVEEILKGEKNLFFGIAYSLIQLMQRKGLKMQSKNNEEVLNNQNEFTSRVERQKIMSVVDQFCHNHVEWVRFLQRTNPKVCQFKIRNDDELRRWISSGLFLYSFAQNSMIRPIYCNPSQVEQKEANLKKITCYLSQNNIVLDKDELINTRLIAQNNIKYINSLIDKLILYSVQKAGPLSQQIKLVSFMNQNHIGQGNRLQPECVMESIQLSKYLHQNESQKQKARLDTTSAEYLNQTHHQNTLNSGYPSNKIYASKQINPQPQPQQPEFDVQIPWMRKLGFNNCSLNLNNGILLCRLLSKLARTNIKFNQNISTDARIPKPQALGYIRKALKLIPSFKFDEIDVFEANERKTLEIYDQIKEKFRSTYQMSKILSSR